MMQLTMKVNEYEDPNTISQWVGERQPMFDTMAEIDRNWPGVKQWNVWFNDTIFGRYRNLAHLHEMEVEEVEEETDEHMDATALSTEAELEALIRPLAIRASGDDSTGCDEEHQPTAEGEGASVEADHSEPEHQADSEASDAEDVPLGAGSVDTPKPDELRPAIPLIKIGLRS